MCGSLSSIESALSFSVCLIQASDSQCSTFPRKPHGHSARNGFCCKFQLIHYAAMVSIRIKPHTTYTSRHWALIHTMRTSSSVCNASRHTFPNFYTTLYYSTLSEYRGECTSAYFYAAHAAVSCSVFQKVHSEHITHASVYIMQQHMYRVIQTTWQVLSVYNSCIYT